MKKIVLAMMAISQLIGIPGQVHAAEGTPRYLVCDMPKDIYGNEDSVNFTAKILSKKKLQDVRMVWASEIIVFSDSVTSNPNYKAKISKYKDYIQFKMNSVDDLACNPSLVLAPGFSQKDPLQFERIDASIRLSCDDNEGIYNGTCVVRSYR